MWCAARSGGQDHVRSVLAHLLWERRFQQHVVRRTSLRPCLLIVHPIKHTLVSVTVRNSRFSHDYSFRTLLLNVVS